MLGGGSPLADARGFKQWRAAFRLVERGAHVTLTDAATLGLDERVTSLLAAVPRPSRPQIDRAFWSACHGGRRGSAEILLDRGAELNWLPPWESLAPLDAAIRDGAEGLVDWLRIQGATSASESP